MPPETVVSVGAAAVAASAAACTREHQELCSWQAKLNRRSIAKSVSIMYGLLSVSVSYTFVVAMLWMDDFSRLTTDVVSTIIILPGLAFIIYAFCSMFEQRRRSSSANKISPDSRPQSSLQAAYAPTATTDALNDFLKIATLILAFGAVVQQVMLIIDHHTGPVYTDYPEMYLRSIRKHEAKAAAVRGEDLDLEDENDQRLQHVHFHSSLIFKRLVIERIFWHSYVILCILTFTLSAAFLICLSRFRFEKHRLISCIGLVHLCVLNIYMWLYLTALETKSDLEIDDDSRENHVVEHLLLKQTTNNTMGSHFNGNATSAKLLLLARPHQFGRVFNLNKPESAGGDESSSSSSLNNNSSSSELDSSDSSEWQKKLMAQKHYESVPKKLAEVFFPFIPEFVIINVSTLLVTWLALTRNSTTKHPHDEPRSFGAPTAKFTLKTRHHQLDVWESITTATSRSSMKKRLLACWRALKHLSICGWLVLALSSGILIATIVFVVLLPSMFSLGSAWISSSSSEIASTSLRCLLPLVAECVLNLSMIISSVRAWYCLNRLAQLSTRRHQSVRDYLDRALLAVGIYTYATWSLIGLMHTPNAVAIVSTVSNVLLIIEATAQAILIFHGRNRVMVAKHCIHHHHHHHRPHQHSAIAPKLSLISQSEYSNGKQKNRSASSGRLAIAFLIFINNVFWIINVFRTLQAREHPLELAYYGALGWTIIVHLTVPAMILFRFHAAVMLFEIWRNLGQIVVPMPLSPSSSSTQHQQQRESATSA